MEVVLFWGQNTPRLQLPALHPTAAPASVHLVSLAKSLDGWKISPMGMFDYVICELPLPQQPQPPRTRLFQTKDTTPQCLERFTITLAGRLIHHSMRYQQMPLSERPFPATPFIGSIRAIPVGDVDTKFHGVLEFHDYDSETREYWSYEAKFIDGQCVEICCAAYERHAG